MDFHRVEFRCFQQASEDPAKVERALATVMGLVLEDGELEDPSISGALDSAGVVRGHIEGQFRNPMVILSVTVSKRRAIREYWSVLSRLAPEVLRTVAGQLEDRLDEELVLHFRFGKQPAFTGSLVLDSGGDTIAVRCKPKVFTGGWEKARDDVRGFLLGLADGSQDGRGATS